VSIDLRKRFAAKDTPTLVGILESPEAYTPEAYAVAEEELYSRLIPEVELKKLASDFVRQVAQEKMNRLDPLNDELVLPKSHFLLKKEVKDIYLEELNALMKRKDGFRFDVWQYAMGG